MSDLRDHSQPCEHDKAFLALNSIGGLDAQTRAWKCKDFGCPGGRQVTIDWEAATLRAAIWLTADLVDPVGAAKDIVAAAIGDTDE